MTPRIPPKMAFTLVELLVVVTIIVILIAILLPSIDKAIDLAETAVCRTNFRNMNMATSMYLMDNKSTFMNHRRTDGGNPDGTKEQFWATDLFKYGMSPNAFRCPVLKGPRVDWNYSWSWEFGQHKIGYGYNGRFLGLYPYGTDAWAGASFKATRVVNPSDNLIFGETQPVHGAAWSQSIWWDTSSMSRTDGTNEGISINRHTTGSIASFNDGHNDVVAAVDYNPVGPVEYDPRSIKYWDPLQRVAP